LLLAHSGKEGTPEAVVPKIGQEMLAEMIGATRSRVSFFMNRFRKLGFIHYNGGLQVHSSLRNVVLHDWPSFLRRKYRLGGMGNGASIRESIEERTEV
jgi:CRP/FNR family transcriptional regulator, cyclic AMP receptor protein